MRIAHTTQAIRDAHTALTAAAHAANRTEVRPTDARQVDDALLAAAECVSAVGSLFFQIGASINGAATLRRLPEHAFHDARVVAQTLMSLSSNVVGSCNKELDVARQQWDDVARQISRPAGTRQ